MLLCFARPPTGSIRRIALLLLNWAEHWLRAISAWYMAALK